MTKNQIKILLNTLNDELRLWKKPGIFQAKDIVILENYLKKA